MFKFNNRTPKKIKYNGLNVAKLIFNGVVVWVEKSKNLFNMMAAVNGTTILDNGDGTITVTSYPAYTNTPLSVLAPDLKVGDKIAFSMKTTGYSSIYMYNRNTSFSTYFNNGGTYTITQEMLDSAVYLYRKTGSQGGGNAVISGIQIEYGEKVTEYEPYYAKEV